MNAEHLVASKDGGMDLWRVQLRTGEVRAMSLDVLDDAFQAGSVDESTPVLPPGAMSWTRLADAAGLDAPEAQQAADSVAPIALSVGRGPMDPAMRMMPPPDFSLPDVDLDTIEPEAFKAKKGRVFAVIGLAALLLGGVGFAGARYVPMSTSGVNALRAEADRKAAAAAPLKADQEEEAATRLRVLTEQQRIKLLEADKAREAREAAETARKKERAAAAAARHSGKRKPGAAPFANGGDKYDPLNGSL